LFLKSVKKIEIRSVV